MIFYYVFIRTQLHQENVLSITVLRTIKTAKNGSHVLSCLNMKTIFMCFFCNKKVARCAQHPQHRRFFAL